MTLRNYLAPLAIVEAMARPRWRQCLAGLFAVTVAASCQPRPEVGEVGNVEGFLGGIAVEEPNAALAARDVLSAGGSAADAAVAAYFIMSVTYPYGTGLGGGGVCVYYDAQTNKAEALDFLPRVPAEGGTVAVPGSIRGMAALHSRYGRLRWAQLIAPAETMARFGFPVSRALARRLDAARGHLSRDDLARDTYIVSNNDPIEEGDELARVELSTVLTRLRAKGVADFYGGEMGRWFVDDATRIGGRVSIEDLRGFAPAWRTTMQLPMGNEILHLPPRPLGAEIARQLVAQADGGALVRETARAFPDSVSHNPQAGDAALVVADNRGSAAACEFTMNGAFGTGQVLPTSGMLAARALPPEQTLLAPMVIANHHTSQAFMAVAASGAAAGVAAASETVVVAGRQGRDLSETVAAPRRYTFAGGASTFAEDGEGDGGPVLGVVQSIHCPGGLKHGQSTCQFVTDPRGHGLTAGQKF